MLRNLNDGQFFLIFYLLPGLIVFFLLPKSGATQPEPTMLGRLQSGGIALACVLLWPIVLLGSLAGNRR